MWGKPVRETDGNEQTMNRKVSDVMTVKQGMREAVIGWLCFQNCFKLKYFKITRSYIYIYIYIYIYVHIYTYIHIYLYIYLIARLIFGWFGRKDNY